MKIYPLLDIAIPYAISSKIPKDVKRSYLRRNIR
jgi:hypothetical protein